MAGLAPAGRDVTFMNGSPTKKGLEKRMLNFQELGDYIGLSPQTIRNKFYAGEFPIPAKKIFSKVLWDRKDVDAYLDRLNRIDC
jgi:predicted DNA-binding transcriptional regulator AlpA